MTASSLNNQAGYDLIQSGCGQFSSWLLWLYMTRIIPIRGQYWGPPANERPVLLAGYLRRSHKSDRTISIIPAQSGVTQTLSPSSVLASDGSTQITCLWWATSNLQKTFIRGLCCFKYIFKIEKIFFFSLPYFLYGSYIEIWLSPWVKQVERDVYDIYVHISFQKFHPLIQQHSGTNFVEDMNIK